MIFLISTLVEQNPKNSETCSLYFWFSDSLFLSFLSSLLDLYLLYSRREKHWGLFLSLSIASKGNHEGKQKGETKKKLAAACSLPLPLSLFPPFSSHLNTGSAIWTFCVLGSGSTSTGSV